MTKALLLLLGAVSAASGQIHGIRGNTHLLSAFDKVRFAAFIQHKYLVIHSFI